MAEDAREQTAVPEAGAPTPEDGSVVVSVRDVSRRFGVGDAAVDALRSVSIDFQRGKLAAIMGPSGSGKSTLMHIMAGLDTPTAGKVWIDGVEITSLPDRRLTLLRREKIGFVFQFFNLLPMLTAEENLELPLTIAGRKGEDEWKRSLIEQVGIADRLKHKPSELSGGQQQRVAIARALISRPAVIFADEPTGNLDTRSGDEVLQMLRNSVNELGQTVVMVTHDPLAASIADRIVFLLDGRIVKDGPGMQPAEILDVMKSFG